MSPIKWLLQRAFRHVRRPQGKPAEAGWYELRGRLIPGLKAGPIPGCAGQRAVNGPNAHVPLPDSKGLRISAPRVIKELGSHHLRTAGGVAEAPATATFGAFPWFSALWASPHATDPTVQSFLQVISPFLPPGRPSPRCGFREASRGGTGIPCPPRRRS